MILGIEDLGLQSQLLEEGCTYLMGVETRGLALKLALFALLKNSHVPSTLVLDRVDAAAVQATGLGERLTALPTRIFSVNDTVKTVKKGCMDLYRAGATAPGALIIFLLDSVQVAGLSEDELREGIGVGLNFCVRTRSALLYLCYGREYLHCSGMAGHIRRLNGVAEFYYLQDDLILNTVIWRSGERSLLSGEHHLALTEEGFSAHARKSEQIASQDQDEFYINDEKFTPDQNSYRTVLRFESNDALYRAAADKASAATCIFCLKERGEIDTIGQYLHALRRSRGNALVLLVWERVPNIRANSERFLLSCGANFCFPSTATDAYIYAMSMCFKGQLFARVVPADFESISGEYHLIDNQENGYLKPEEFIAAVGRMISNEDIGINGRSVLVSLQPKPPLNAELAASMFNPARGGDICTVMSRQLVVFLPSCSRDALIFALRRIFTLEPEKLFVRQNAHFSNGSILEELSLMQRKNKVSEPDESVLKLVKEAQKARGAVNRGHKKLSEFANLAQPGAQSVDLRQFQGSSAS